MRRLDGNPLAIELSAARAAELEPVEIDRLVATTIGFLRGNAGDPLPRHRTIDAAVLTSWKLLDPELQHALWACTVFVGPFTEEAFHALSGVEDPERARDMLGTLVKGSLIRVDDGSDRSCGRRSAKGALTTRTGR